MLILDGKEVSKTVRSELKSRIEKFKNSTGRTPGLAVVLIGDNPASHVYVRNKEKSCESVGIQSFRYNLSAQCTQEEAYKLIKKLNDDPLVDGILVQLPLPKHLNTDTLIEAISPLKDADGLTMTNMGKLWAGRPLVAPCTPSGVMTILKHYKIPISGKKAVVVGRSNIVGKPMAHLLMEANATVTICHSKTENIKEHTQQADIVVVAAGKPQFMGKNDFKKDAIVVDVGIHGSGEGTGICGDVRFSELQDWAQAATPVPGGVGPMTITTLLQNTLILAEHRLNKK